MASITSGPSEITLDENILASWFSLLVFFISLLEKAMGFDYYRSVH